MSLQQEILENEPTPMKVRLVILEEGQIQIIHHRGKIESVSTQMNLRHVEAESIQMSLRHAIVEQGWIQMSLLREDEQEWTLTNLHPEGITNPPTLMSLLPVEEPE